MPEKIPVLSWNANNILGYPRISQILGGRMWNHSLFGNHIDLQQVKELQITGDAATEMKRDNASAVSEDIDAAFNEPTLLETKNMTSNIEQLDQNAEQGKEESGWLLSNDASYDSTTCAISSPRNPAPAEHKSPTETG